MAKGGPKLKVATGAPPPAFTGETPSGSSVVVKNGTPQFAENAGSAVLFTAAGGLLRGRHQTMQGLAKHLSAQLHAPVLDATSLDGEYDFDMPFAPEPVQLSKTDVIVSPMAAAGPAVQASPATPDDLPSLLTALQTQLGLKVEAVKAVPIEVVVLDKANRDPTPN